MVASIVERSFVEDTASCLGEQPNADKEPPVKIDRLGHVVLVGFDMAFGAVVEGIAVSCLWEELTSKFVDRPYLDNLKLVLDFSKPSFMELIAEQVVIDNSSVTSHCSGVDKPKQATKMKYSNHQ